jgi:hypothetical protein
MALVAKALVEVRVAIAMITSKKQYICGKGMQYQVFLTFFYMLSVSCHETQNFPQTFIYGTTFCSLIPSSFN